MQKHDKEVIPLSLLKNALKIIYDNNRYQNEEHLLIISIQITLKHLFFNLNSPLSEENYTL